MSRQQLFATGIVALTILAPRTPAAQSVASAGEVVSSHARIAAARATVEQDRTTVAHLEQLIARQRDAMATGWGFPLDADYWDRVFVLGGPPKVLADLENKLSRAYQKFSRDRAHADSLELALTR